MSTLIRMDTLAELRQWAVERARVPGGLVPWLAFVDTFAVMVVPRELALAKYPQLTDHGDPDALIVVHVTEASTVARVEVWQIERVTLTPSPEIN